MSNLLTPNPPSPEAPRPKQVTGEAKALIHAKRNPFAKDRYTVSLAIDEVHTGLHWHAKRKKQAAKVARWAADNAADILMAYGLTNLVMNQLEQKRYGLPEVGAKIRLLVEISDHYPAGTEGVVTHSEWDDANRAENNYPVMAKLTDTEGHVSYSIPLALAEIEVIS